MTMPSPKLIAAVVAASVIACGSSGEGYPLGVGEDEGGAQAFDGGTADPAALDARIEENQMAVKLITLSCADACATVQAVASGGNPPYHFAWEDGSTNPTRKVCPASDTSYVVRVTDTAKTGELPHPAESAQASVTADVITCPDGGTPGDVGAGSCQAGTYVGTTTGTGLVDAGPSATSSPITIPFTLPLVAGDAGAELVPAGPLTINWDIAADWTPSFSGGLDCATGAFRAEDPETPETVAGVPAGTCDMTYVGTLDRATATLSGTWTADCSGEVWAGTWTVMRM
jgi:hypothetical protein